jgi:hypothetical protein
MIGHWIFPFLSLTTAAAAFTLQDTDIRNIQSYVNSFSDVSTGASSSLCTANSCCNISSSNSCSLMKFTKDKSTLVLPGGETRCIFSTSTPFAFQVIPGATDKVLLYFQGGGACWDQSSTKLGFCTTDSQPQSPVGIFDRTNALNEYRDYTIVHVLYCSGDVFGGDIVRSYTDSSGVPVTQKGAANAQSAVDWLVQQQANGSLDAILSSFAVMGCSAGSIGAQLWSDSALKALKWNKVCDFFSSRFTFDHSPSSRLPLCPIVMLECSQKAPRVH